MKRWIAVFLFLIIPVFVPYGIAESSPGKLTLLVYMCGNNLESTYGYASADLKEMAAARFGPEVSVLVMAGGSEFWDTGFDAGKTSIIEISNGQQKVLWDHESLNMGEPETLAFFLSYARENRPAEDNALILWDHGRGPLEGVCWDQLYSPDNLSLTELTVALAKANLPKKLKWIGFDACLMSSLEVAAALSPYAEYMTASQENEPPFGWNYSFLSGIENDRTGADTGKRIIDAYFAGRDDYKDILTLSCLDLSGIDEIMAEMDRFFSPAALNITPDTFSLLSNIRKATTGFGKALPAVDEDGCDLVDAKELVRLLGAEFRNSEHLSDLLDSFVIHNRSNEEGPGGVSLYHPYVNKTSYLEKWRESYSNLGFSTGYTGYISAFGNVLTGLEIADWSGLAAKEKAETEQETLLTLQLTPEQQENFASAQLLIMYDIFTANQPDRNCALIYAGKADIDPQGMLSASYAGQSLWIEQENGELYGPLAFSLADDEQYAFVHMLYMADKTKERNPDAHVLYYLKTDSGTAYPDIARTKVWDSVTQTFTSRIAFDESRYGSIHLVEAGRQLPAADDRGLLPMYYDWEDGSTPMFGSLDVFSPLDIFLPDQWRFRWMDGQVTGKQLYAVFQVTDTQQNTFCSSPIPIPNPNRKKYTGFPDTAGNQDISAGMEAYVINSPMGKWLQLSFTAANKSDGITEYRTSNLMINGKRLIEGSSLHFKLEAGDAYGPAEIAVSPAELYGIDTIETIETTVTVRRDDTKTEVPVLFRLEGCDIHFLWEDVIPLSETEQDGVTLRLLSLKPYIGSGIDASVLITNDRNQALKPEGSCTVGNIELNGISGTNEIPAHLEVLRSFELSNRCVSYDLETIDENKTFYSTAISDHLLQHEGITQISELTLYLNHDRGGRYQEAFRLQLARPWDLQEGEINTYLNTSMIVKDPDEFPHDPESAVLLAENDQYTASCKKLLTGKNGIALKLEIVNKTNAPLALHVINPELDGVPAVSDQDSDWYLAPAVKKFVSLTLSEADASPLPDQLSSISFGLESAEQKEQGNRGPVCEVSFTEPLKTGDYHAAWISTDRIVTEGVRLPDGNQPEQENHSAVTDQMLESDVILPSDAKELTLWIPAGLTDEQISRCRSGQMYLGRLVNDGAAFELLSIHYLERGPENQIGIRCPGMILCPEAEPNVGIFTANVWDDSDQLDFYVVYDLVAFNDHNEEAQTVEELVIRADLAKNHAAISDIKLTGSSDSLYFVSIPPFAKFVPDTDEELSAPVMEWGKGKRGTAVRTVYLKGAPLRLMLRPITAEDRLYCIFDIVEKDGTEYSLPMFPYPLQ